MEALRLAQLNSPVHRLNPLNKAVYYVVVLGNGALYFSNIPVLVYADYPGADPLSDFAYTTENLAHAPHHHVSNFCDLHCDQWIYVLWWQNPSVLLLQMAFHLEGMIFWFCRLFKDFKCGHDDPTAHQHDDSAQADGRSGSHSFTLQVHLHLRCSHEVSSIGYKHLFLTF